MAESLITVREATFRLLRELGIHTIFGNPGSTELPMFRDFPDDFRYVLALQEAGAVGMADGFAQATGKAALVNLHSSAGTGNALGNLFTAYKNQAPLVITAGQQARSILPFEPFLFAERATEFPRPFVKWASEPARAQDVPHAIARAYFEAMTPPYGPAFVSVPADDWDVLCQPLSAKRIATENPGSAVAITDLAQKLAHAARPALVLGAGTARDGAWADMIALAERVGSAVYTAPYASRNVFPEDHGLFHGFLPAFREPLIARLTGHDLIVVFGGPLNLYHSEDPGPHVPRDAEVWMVCDNPGVLAWAPAKNSILANTRAASRQLLRELGDGEARAAPSPRRVASELQRTVFDDKLVFSRIERLLPRDAIVVEEAPSSRPAMQEYLRLKQPDTFYTTGSGGLGYALPAAVGVSLANPGKRVLAIVGDGSAMYSIQALFTAYQLKCPITFVVINNVSYRALRQFGTTFGMNAVPGTDLAGLDFLGLARGHGIAASRAENAQQLDTCLKASFLNAGPSLVEARIA